jgi:hypothetical protein
MLSSVLRSQAAHGIVLSAGLPFGEARKHALHRIDSGEIAMDIVIATPLTAKQPKTSPRIALARRGAAQVDHSSHILLLLERSGRDSAALQRARYAAIQVGSSTASVGTTRE